MNYSFNGKGETYVLDSRSHTDRAKKGWVLQFSFLHLAIEADFYIVIQILYQPCLLAMHGNGLDNDAFLHCHLIIISDDQ